jgi:glycosyltransferase involved in cell wall biosynthesis
LSEKTVGIMMAYNNAGQIARAYETIPKQYFDDIILVDDGSTDNTMDVAKGLGIPAFTHPHEGYGGNLYFGFHKAVERGGTRMIELHGDGQYDFSAVPAALEMFNAGYDLILGNRFYKLFQPLQDGMDLIRFVGNIGLSSIGRIGLGIPTRDLFLASGATAAGL